MDTPRGRGELTGAGVKGAVNGVDFEKIAGSSDLFLGNDEGRISTTYAYTLAHNSGCPREAGG